MYHAVGAETGGANMVLRSVISNIEGIVVNTESLPFGAWKKALADLDLDLTLEEYRANLTPPFEPERCGEIMDGFDTATLEAAAASAKEDFLERVEETLEIYPSTIALFEEIIANGTRLAAVSTSGYGETLLNRIGLADIFDEKVFAGETARPAPLSRIYRIAAGRLDVQPAECVLLDATDEGVAAGRSCGFVVVGVDRYGAPRGQDGPRRLGAAHHVVDDLGEIDHARLAALCGDL